MNSVVETRQLTKRFGPVVAVDQLSITVGPGEIYAFLGLNGAGKTTTIRMLLGMIRATAGSASVLGFPVRPGDTSPWSSVGYLVEMPHAYPELTVRENLELIRGLRSLRDPDLVDHVIDALRLGPYADRRARTLSLGNAQRLGLAKALMHRPQVLILDEPANGLDPAGIVEVRLLLADLARNHGTTIFMSSHILGEVSRLATRIGIIHQGHLILQQDADVLERDRRQWLIVDARDRRGAASVLEASGHPFEYAIDGSLVLRHTEALEKPDGIALLLTTAGHPPTLLKVEQEDLESFFLRLVGMPGGEPQ